jgi:hypothetical protein
MEWPIIILSINSTVTDTLGMHRLYIYIYIEREREREIEIEIERECNF